MNTINYKNTSIVFIIIIFIIYYLTFIIASIIEYKCNKLIKNKTIEKFNNKYTSKINKNKKKKILNLLKKIKKIYPSNPVQLQRYLYYYNKLHDKNLMKYNKKYLNSLKSIPFINKYNPYNFNNINLYSISSKSEKNKDLKAYNDYINKHYNARFYTKFYNRKQLCPDYKCQRKYMTCTTNHLPKISNH